MRTLGQSTLRTKPLAFGGNVFGWTADEKTSFQLLDAFIDHGFNFIDTADVYSRWVAGNVGGESETIIGKWLRARQRRDDVILATKVGMDMGAAGVGLSKKHILASVDASLKRLQTDYIDLYQTHCDDQDVTFEETFTALDTLQQAGKIKFIGASNYTAGRLQQAIDYSHTHHHSPFVSLQPLYNLYDRADFEAELMPICEKNQLGVISYYSLASGFLSGKYRSIGDVEKSKRAGQLKKYMNPKGERIIKAVRKVAEDAHKTPAQIALAWLIANPAITAAIVSATTLLQLKEILSSTEIKLDQNALTLLAQAASSD